MGLKLSALNFVPLGQQALPPKENSPSWSSMEKLHTVTASMCADTHGSEIELKSPPSRRWARLLMIVAVGVLLLIAIVVMAVRIPEFQTTKTTFSSGASEVSKLEKVLAEGVINKQSITCPCSSQVMSWCQMTTFHVYTATSNASQPFHDRLTLTKDDGSTNLTTICFSRDDAMKQNICESALTRVINSKDSRTDLEMGSAYTSPERLYVEITERIDTTSYEEANSHAYLLMSNNGSRLYNYSDGITRLLRDMAHQFAKSNRSTAKDFWAASNDTRNMYHELKFGFGMEVNWTTYLENCAPPFCEVQSKVSMLNRVLRAAGQVGGITTMVSLGLRFVLWPFLRTALNFSAAPA